jgi:hypothetical protein
MTQKAINWIFALVMAALVGLLLYVWFGVAQKARERADMIHGYLGNNRGENPATWSGLTGNIKENNLWLKDTINKLRKDVCILQGTPPDRCPDGGPADSPVRPPNYPP